jgi:hypothetical protein
MIRALLYAFLSIVVITFIRMIAGIIMKGVGDAFKEEASSSGRPRSTGSGPVPTAGELKACQTCGTYVLASAAKTLAAGGKTAYFCSEDCRSKALS